MPVVELRRMKKTKPESNFLRRDFSRNVTSQYGEDGVIARIFELIGTRNKWCVEFGAWDGEYLSNTWALINEHGWSAVLAEGDAQKAAHLTETYSPRPDVVIKHAFVSWEGPNRLEPVMNFPHRPISCGLIAESSGFQVLDNREIEQKRGRTPRNRAD